MLQYGLNNVAIASRICCFILTALILPTTARSDQSGIRFDPDRLRLEFCDRASTPWLINGCWENPLRNLPVGWGSTAYRSNAIPYCRVAFDEADGNAAKPAHIFAAVVFVDARFVFAERDVHDSMQRVLDCPVTSNRPGKTSNVTG